MRIVGGALRGRRLVAPEGQAVRPTADRAREGLFNILDHGAAFADFSLSGATVVDVFAGTGALGLEALSRGAEHAFFFENDAEALRALRRNIAALDQGDRAEVLNRDAARPGHARARCALALFDPPYGADLAAPALSALAENGWFADNAIAVVEHAADETLIPPESFEPIDQRRYGAAAFTFFRWLINQ